MNIIFFCNNCIAYNYEETGSIFNKTDYTCELIKAKIEANKYYWNKLADAEHTTIDNLIKNTNI